MLTYRMNLLFITFLFFPLIFPVTTPESLEAFPIQDPIPDYIFYNGTVTTMEASRPVVSAVATLGDIIIALGNETEFFKFAVYST